MANKPKSKQAVQRSRRKLLTVLSVGAAAAKLPEVWSKPTVASVMLPAHAARSPAMPEEGCSAVRLFADLNPGTESLTFRLGAVATDLPPGGDFFMRFTFVTFLYSLSASSLSPGVYGGTMAQFYTYPSDR